MHIRISDMVGEYAITAEDGDLVFQPVHEALVAGEDVEVDFEGVAVFASPFFNAAIGRLLEDISQETLRARLRLHNLSSDGHDVVRRVIENAKGFYSDPNRRQAIENALEHAASAQE
jgi:STAS-like domain of unknown function (DUF4325)